MKLVSVGFVTVLFVFSLCACQGRPSIGAEMKIISTSDSSNAAAVAVLQSRQRLISMNTSIGSEALTVTYSENKFQCFRDIIAARFFTDYEELYGTSPQPADANFLTITQAKKGYRVFLERANGLADDGFYVPTKGLIYQFNNGCDQPDRVGPTDY